MILKIVEKSDKDVLYITLMLVMFFLLDLAVVGGILYKGHANFPELIKHLKS
jgi:hypothetical protein